MQDIIVVGTDHQNTLGIIRALASSGYTVNVIIHSAQKRVKCFSSRYLNGIKMAVSGEEKALLEAIFELGSEVGAKPIPIIPTSDFAAFCIDKNLDTLQNDFITPSIDGQPGKIVQYMDKFFQKRLADESGILMADTTLIGCEGWQSAFIPEGWSYPCMLKPVLSASGSKSDICKVSSQDELRSALKTYRENSYSDVLLQEYIDKDYELCTFGCITKNSRELYYGTLKKLRLYPYTGGSSLTYAQFVNVDALIKPIIELLAGTGYDGLFDFEVFCMGDRLYLNELNFRNSGNTWAMVKSGVNAPLAWVADALGQRVPFEKHVVDDDSYFINETADIHHIFSRRISVFRWAADMCKAKSYNKFWLKDIPGSIVWYLR